MYYSFNAVITANNLDRAKNYYYASLFIPWYNDFCSFCRKDVRNAVESANKAQPGWEKRSGFNRSQILYYLAENLEQRREEFATHLAALTG